MTAATTTVAALAFLVPLGFELRHNHREQVLAAAERQSSRIVGALSAGAGPKGLAAALAGVSDQVKVHRPGETAGGRAPGDEVRHAANSGSTVTETVDGGLVRLEPITVAGRTSVVEVFVPDSDLDGGEGAWWLLLGIAAVLVAASVIVVDRLARGAVTSARNLVQAAMAVGGGDLGVRIQPSGPRELAEAGYAFNRMADRLVTSRTSEREMVADLSHRLRTPLTALRLDAEALDPDDTQIISLSPDEIDRRRGIRRIRQAIVTLEGEVNELINTTRQAVAAQVAAAPETGVCDVSEVVRERMTFWSALAGDQNRNYRVVGAQLRIPVPVARAELAAALDAILGNVFRYTPQGTAFEVGISRRDGWVAVRVDDAGPGIGDPEKAMQRGQSNQGSTGLGLDIARRAAQSTGGSVSLDRAAMGGASVVMLFADAEATPKQASRFGLVGRLARERASRPARSE
ncbi:HAMP domain-containing sensor histidine kinase [Paractinoplanes hotanensis]|uniref:histidine kinase n=1 Tax=Paractinoplanes hotanensis TaxID=2906497 RepID=A0ABT0XZ24_9ACTN|nr:HAMP domain-containing sensor histidine kinase [Actinoplanes hotanensis]MCM4079045.1 HAMP domain-containing histidine kinase [Actinoplanes hotanensis]